MINPVSSSSNTYPTSAAKSSHKAPPPAQSKTEAPQDTVKLSKAALSAAGGDADHDGDSK